MSDEQEVDWFICNKCQKEYSLDERWICKKCGQDICPDCIDPVMVTCYDCLDEE